VCAGQPGVGSQAKSVTRSTDDGESWQVVHGQLDSTPDGRTSGYVSDVAALSPERLWIAEGRAGLIGSTDGGRTWTQFIAGGDETGGVGGGQIIFVDALHGWALVDKALWRTVDGGITWNGPARF
jgi:photosystem II stability/assembly factor-like uncharacterized protein